MISRISNDLLKESDKKGRLKYSQGRVYLAISFVVFFVMNLILIGYAFSNRKLDDQHLEIILAVSTNLKWALSTFSLYILGGKTIGAVTDRQNGISNDYMHESNQPIIIPNPYGGGMVVNKTNQSNNIDQEFYGGEGPSMEQNE